MPSSPLQDFFESVKKHGKSLQKHPVSVETYDVAQGSTHGILQAIACGILNPLDKKIAAAATQKQLVPAELTVHGPKQPFTFHGAQRFKAWFPEHPWAGTLYGIKTRILPNAATFTFVPMIKDKLEGGSFTSLQCDVIAGLSGSIPEAAGTARSKAIRVQHQLYTSTLPPDAKPPTPRDYWNTLPANLRSANVRSALIWGIAKNSGYWAVFPAATTLLELQFTAIMKSHQLENSPGVETIGYAAAGALAGGLATLMSNPLDVIEKRAIRDPDTYQLKRVWDYFCQHGLWKTVTHETHPRFLGLSLPRMMAGSALLNLTAHAAKGGCDTVLEKERPQPAALLTPK